MPNRLVAEREGLTLKLLEGDMRDLSVFSDGSFDLVFHPVSNNFVPEVRPVWREAYRVLRPGGTLLAGFMNPAMYVFESAPESPDVFVARYSLPFDATRFSEEERLRMWGEDSQLEFSHTLEDQIGGQLEAGFIITNLYEDYQDSLPGRYMPAYIATRAIKPA